MKKLVLLAVAATVASSPALAISRYNSPSMTCEAARAAILSQGAVILRYPSQRVAGMTLYDRYVHDNSQCDQQDYAERAYVPTRDNPRCPVLACKPIDDNENSMFRRPWIRF